MLLVPNHHVIVPRTEDMAFRMPNKITKLGAQRNALEHEVFLNDESVVSLPFNPRSVFWAEVYINGVRVLNLQYPTTHTRGIPHEQFKVTSDSVVFGSNVTGLVKVIVDQDSQPLAETTTDTALKGLIIDVDNFQSFDIYEQRFTPARWASNSYVTTSTGPYGISNSQIRHRFSDAFYTEPMVITQPHCGYVRPTADRKNLLYVPAFNFQGYDCFTYTFLTQHGQIGEPKTIHIEVFGAPANMTHSVSANVAVVVEGGYAKFQLLTNGVCPGEQLPFRVSGTATTTQYQWLNDYTNGGGYVNASHEFGVFIIDEDTTRTGDMPGRATIDIETFLDNDYTPSSANVYIELLCDTAANAEVEIIGATLSLTANVPWMIPGQCVQFTARLNSPKTVPLALNYEIVEELYDIETLTSTTSTFMNGTFNLVLNTSNTVYCTSITCPPADPNSQLLTNILKTSVVNGSFESGLTGWDLYTPGQDDIDLIVKLDGNSTIAGWPTPVSSFAGRSVQAKKIAVSQVLFESGFNTDDKTDGSQSLSLFAYGRVTYSGYLRGPIVVSQNLYRLPVGSVFQFDYRGIAIDDYYDAVIYLLNPLTGTSLMLLDKFGPTDPTFVTVSKTITSADVGVYRLVICGGGHDNTNGGVIGAELLIDNIKITGATGVYPCNPIKRMITARLLDDYTIRASTQVVNLDGFNLTVAQNTVFEGETISFNLHNYDFCSNVLINAKIPYSVTYKDLTLYNSDFVNNVFPLSGNFIMSSFDANGYVSTAVTYNTFDDFIPLERPETFYISPFDCPTIGNSVTIYDSCPSIIAVPHTSSILEGETVNFFYRIKDLNTPYRTRNLSWEVITDGTLSLSDFSTPVTGNIEGNLEATNPLSGVLSFSTVNRSPLNLANFDNFYIKFYTNQVTKASCYVTPQVRLIQVPPPTPTPTPTPKPAKTPPPTGGGGTTPAPTPGASCAINTSISGGGVIKVKGACPGDNNFVTIMVTLSRAITTNAPKSGSRLWGSCIPPYKSVRVTNSLMVSGSFSPQLVIYGSTSSAPFILLGQESLNASGTSWRLYYTAQTTTPAGTYKVTLLDNTGLATVPGQCQNNKAITGPTGYVTFTVIR